MRRCAAADATEVRSGEEGGVGLLAARAVERRAVVMTFELGWEEGERKERRSRGVWGVQGRCWRERRMLRRRRLVGWGEGAWDRKVSRSWEVREAAVGVGVCPEASVKCLRPVASLDADMEVRFSKSFQMSSARLGCWWVVDGDTMGS